MSEFHYRILVVDDDEQIREVSQTVLTQCGFEVRTVRNGFEALAAMRRAKPDLIISDLNMPNMSGFELLSVVRRRFPQIPVIAISAEFIGTSIGCLILADAIFHKGQYEPRQLFEAIQKLLEESPPRPHSTKPDHAPVWIPRNGGYVVLTCPDCMRSFSIPEEEAQEGLCTLSCIHCSAEIRFVLDPK